MYPNPHKDKITRSMKLKHFMKSAVRGVKSFIVNKAMGGANPASLIASNFGNVGVSQANTQPVQKLLKRHAWELNHPTSKPADPLGFQHIQYPPELTGTEVGNWILFFSISTNVGDNPAHNSALELAESQNIHPGKKWVSDDGITELTDYDMYGKEVDKIRHMYAQKGIEIPVRQKTNTVINHNATKDVVTSAIALYMPPDIKVSYGATWDTEESGLSGDVGNAIKEFENRSGKDSLVDIVTNMGKHGGAAVLQRIQQGVGEFTGQLGLGNWVKLLGKGLGVAINNHKEMFYEGPQFREFSYNFKFWPRNVDETNRVQEIIKSFKVHMHPTKDEGWKARVFRYPSEYEIHYLHRTGVNSHLNKIARCALTKCDVSYTAEGSNFKTFEDNYEEEPGAPVTYSVDLSFKELEFMTRDKVADGF